MYNFLALNLHAKNEIVVQRKSKHVWLDKSENGNAILAMIGQIPMGKVATYGQIARLAGIPRNSRQVGSILRSLPSKTKIPWFRVVSSKGEISSRGNSNSEHYQRTKLETEGVEFNKRGRISLKQFGWEPGK